MSGAEIAWPDVDSAIAIKHLVGVTNERVPPKEHPLPLGFLDDARGRLLYSAYACSTRLRTRSCDAASPMGRSSAKLRRSPLTAYWRAGNVTLRPLPLRRSHTANPISFKPSSTPSVKCSSASASLPGGLPLSSERF